MLQIFNSIYYFYDHFIYRGVIRDTAPKDYAIAHSISIGTLLIALNLVTLFYDYIFPLRSEGVLVVLTISVVLLYLLFYKVYSSKLSSERPSVLSIIITLTYILFSFIAFSFFR